MLVLQSLSARVALAIRALGLLLVAWTVFTSNPGPASSGRGLVIALLLGVVVVAWACDGRASGTKRRTGVEPATSSLGRASEVDNMACKSTTFSLTRAPVTALAPQTSPSPCALVAEERGGRSAALAVSNSEPSPAKTKDGRCDPHSISPCRLECLAAGVAVSSRTPLGASVPARGERQIPRPGSRGESLGRSARPGADDGAGGSRSRRARANAAPISVDGAPCASSPAGRALPHPRGGSDRVLAGKRDIRPPGPRGAGPRCSRPGLSAPRAAAILAAASGPGRGALAGLLRPLNRGARRAALAALLTALPHQRSEPASNG
jgi:hypothetical protein